MAAVGDITIALGSVAKIIPDRFTPAASASLNLRKILPRTGKFRFPFLSRTEGKETEGSLIAIVCTDSAKVSRSFEAFSSNSSFFGSVMKRLGRASRLAIARPKLVWAFWSSYKPV